MNETSFRPILEIARSFIKPELNEDNEENLNYIMSILEQYLENKKTREEIIIVLNDFLKSLEPLDKIDSIIKPLLTPNLLNSTGTSLGRQKSIPWTNEEDEKLKKAVEEHGSNNWGTVADEVGNGRTRSQCSQRWNRVINPKISKANWTQEEEQKLLNAVEAYGVKAWTRVASEFGNRSDVQCRFKYNFLMKKK